MRSIRKIAIEQDAVANDSREPRQGERHLVGPGPQVDDAVLAGFGGDGGLDLLNQISNAARQPNHDAGKDQQRHAVANATFGDLLA